MPNLTTNTFKIPVVAIPAILGLRGQKIKDICQTTGATVQLSKPEGKELTATSVSLDLNRQWIQLPVSSDWQSSMLERGTDPPDQLNILLTRRLKLSWMSLPLLQKPSIEFQGVTSHGHTASMPRVQLHLSV